MKYLRSMIYYLLSIVTMFILVTPIHASPVGLSIDPPILRVQIKPGKSITKVFNVENKEELDKNIVVRVIPFTKSDSHGNPIIDVKNNATWLKYFGLSNAEIKFNEPFLLKAKAKEQIILSISIPENANLEDLYTTFLVSTYNNTLDSDQKGTSVGASIGANLLISVTSTLNPSTILKIEKITPISGSFLKIGRKYFADNLTPVTFTATAINDGLFLTDTKGTFKVQNKKNSEVLLLQGILPQYIIAKTNRSLINQDGKSFTFVPNIQNIGLYSVIFDIKSENSNTTNSIDVFFFPFKATFSVLISLIVLKSIFSLTRKNKLAN